MAEKRKKKSFSKSINFENYKKRRYFLKKNLQRMTNGKPFTVILYSGDEICRNSDVVYPFRCNSNFYYLTGFNEPNAWMIMFSDGKRLYEELIISKKKDKTKELWDGNIIGQRRAKKDYLFDEAYPIEVINKIVMSKLECSQCVFFPISDTKFSHTVSGWLSQLKGKKRMGIDNPDHLGDINRILENQRVIKDKDE